jgi:hypothetical protein
MLVSCGVVTAAQPAPLTFEETVHMSERIVIATVQGTTGGSAQLPDGAEIALGMKDPSTGLVFTPYRVRIRECLFDVDGSCSPGEIEVLIPGGTVYETVEHRQRLRTWEVAGAAGAPLPPAGDDVLLFLTRRHDRYFPINDSGARVRVDRTEGQPSFELRFASPRLLSAEGRELARARVTTRDPARSRPEFMESVRLDRVKELIAIVRQVPMPTSGMRDANPRRADAGDAPVVRKRRSRVRAW